MAREELIEAMKKHGLIVESTFVPWSQSRHKNEGHRTLNWRVTLIADPDNGRHILTTDYSAGIAHCPGYSQGDRSILQEETIRRETESGRASTLSGLNGKPILPDSCDVLSALVNDADVLNHSTFESWAGDYGYETDSRKAEQLYRACLETALKLRNGLGETILSELREAAQDY